MINKPITEFILPKYLLEPVQNLLDIIKTDNCGCCPYSSRIISICIKIKLIETMYEEYSVKVDEILKQRTLDETLNTLCYSVDDKKKKTVVNDRRSYDTFQDDKTKFALKQSEIVSNGNIYDFISFYILKGFMNADVFQCLSDINVPITAIIRIEWNIIENFYNETFWNKVYEHFDGSNSLPSLEDTILMKFTIQNDNLEEHLQRLVYLCRSVYEIKLNHLNYIKNLHLHHPKNTYEYYPLDCMRMYCKNLDKFPSECVNIPVILNNLLLEVDSKQKQTKNSFNDDSDDFKIFKRQQKILSDPIIKSFQSQERDLLNILMNCYPKIGPEIYYTSMKMLKTFKLDELYKDLFRLPIEIIHKHDKCPSEVSNMKDDDSLKHFIHLLLINSMHFNEKIENIDAKSKFSENLITYEEWVLFSESKQKFDAPNLCNPSSLNYNWIEPLSSSALLQEFFKAQQDFFYVHKIFSPETETLLIQFHNKLDNFGVNVQYYNQSLRTPVCLRDFCKYITVEETKWLHENYEKFNCEKFELRETCSGTLKLKNLDLYPEYHHLLNFSDDDSSYKNFNEEKTQKLKEIIDELRKFPYSNDVKNFCDSKTGKSFIAYDLSSSYLRLTGTRTIFQSNDDVKLIVDNSRWLYEQSKCVFNLETSGFSLIVHSNEEFTRNKQFGFNFHLNCNAIVSFEYCKTEIDSILYETESESLINEENSLEELETKFTFNEKYLTTIDEKQFQELFSINEENVKDLASDDHDLFFKVLQQSDNSDIYKINSSLKHLKRVNPEIKVPIQNVLKSFIAKESKKVERQKYILRNNEIKSAKNQSFHFRISFSNNLYISPYTSTINSNFYDIKQEYLHPSPVPDEKYRLFTRAGHILIKLSNNSIKILTSNGETLHFTKGVCEENASTLHCPKDLDSYRRCLNSIFGQNDIGANFISRRTHITSKKRVLANSFNDLLENFNLLHQKCSAIKFDGVSYTIESNKIKQTQKYHLVQQEDFLLRRINFERSDGFRCILHTNGVQEIYFADGTKITSSFIHENVNDFVFVTMKYKFEHPNYKSIVFDHLNNLSIYLDEFSIFKQSANQIFNIEMHANNTNACINKNEIVFEKSCNDCDGKCLCRFNIEHFCNNKWNPADEFVKISDSYNKVFSASFVGECNRNDIFIQTPLNAYNCNHTEKVNYKRLFSVNRNLLGEMFLTDSVVEKRKSIQTENSSVKEMVNNNNRTFVQITSFFKNPSTPYSTITFLYEMLIKDDLDKFIHILEYLLENNHKENVEAVKKLKKVISFVKNSELYLKCFRIAEKSIINEPIKQENNIPRINKERVKKESLKYKEFMLQKFVPPYFSVKK